MKLRVWFQRKRYRIEARINGELIAASNQFHVKTDEEGTHIFIPAKGKYLDDLSLTQPKDVPPNSTAANFMETLEGGHRL